MLSSWLLAITQATHRKHAVASTETTSPSTGRALACSGDGSTERSPRYNSQYTR